MIELLVLVVCLAAGGIVWVLLYALSQWLRGLDERLSYLEEAMDTEVDAE